MKFSNWYQKLVCLTSLCQSYSLPMSPSNHLPDPCAPSKAAVHLSKQLEKAVCLVVGLKSRVWPITVTTAAAAEAYGKARQGSKVYKSCDLSHSAILKNPVKIHSCPISWDASKDTELMTTGFESSQSPEVVFSIMLKAPSPWPEPENSQR